MADIKDISKNNFDSEVLNNKGLALVYFYASWCKQCQQTAAVLDAAAQEAGEQVLIGRVNTDTEEAIVTQQKVRTIPFFKIFHQGKVIDTQSGMPSKLELIGLLSNAMSEHEAKNASPEA